MTSKIFSGALIVVSMRWSDRLIGVISTLVLARLLVPDDFGVVAMASLFTGLVDVLLDLGVVASLIHKGRCEDADFNTAWTIRLIQAALAAAIIVIASLWVAEYYNDARVTAVLWVMAGSTLIGGLENIGIVNFQKEMNFAKDFQYFFLRRVAGFLATLILAWLFKSYWALPLGTLVGRLFGLGASYALHPFRPRLTLERFRGMWSFSQWMLLRSIGLYVDSRLDKLLIGHRNDAAMVGTYALSDEISAMPSTELLAPLGRVLFPALVNVRENVGKLRYAFLTALSIQTMIAVPAAAGLALVAREAVAVLLGAKWMGAVPFVQTLSLVYGVAAVSHAAGYLLLTLGKIRLLAVFIWTQLIFFAFGAMTLLAHSEPLVLARWRLSLAVVGALGVIALVVRLVDGLHVKDIVGALWRPFVATSAMAAALLFMPSVEDPTFLELFMRCIVGGIVYGIILIGLWWAVGRPEGGESYLLRKMRLYRA